MILFLRFNCRVLLQVGFICGLACLRRIPFETCGDSMLSVQDTHFMVSLSKSALNLHIALCSIDFPNNMDVSDPVTGLWFRSSHEASVAPIVPSFLM